MKKLLIVLLLALAAVGFVSAADSEGTVTAVTAAAAVNDTVDLTGYVAQKLSITLPESFNIGELGVAGDTGLTYAHSTPINIGNATIKSNIKSWTVTLLSTNGGLKTVQGTEPNILTQTIGYTFAIAGIGSKAILPSANTETFTMNRKTVGEEDFAITLTYNSTATDGAAPANWLSGAYTDTMQVTVAAN